MFHTIYAAFVLPFVLDDFSEAIHHAIVSILSYGGA